MKAVYLGPPPETRSWWGSGVIPATSTWYGPGVAPSVVLVRSGVCVGSSSLSHVSCSVNNALASGPHAGDISNRPGSLAKGELRST